MVAEIDVNFWISKAPVPVNNVFSRMIEAISSWHSLVGNWQGLVVVDRTIQNVLLNTPDSLSLSELQHLIKGYSSNTFQLSTGIEFKCWRFDGSQPERGFLRVQVNSWGRDYKGFHAKGWRFDGEASLSISSCGPYCALLEPEPDLKVQEVNKYVEENLEDLTDLLFHIVESIQPESIKVFTDAGDSLPFNAHLVYYRGESEVVEDLQHLAEVWEHGLPAYNIPPLKQLDPEHNAFVYHQWRDKQAQFELWRRFSTEIPKSVSVSKETIRRTLSSERFDTYNLPTGFAVLEYPYFLNAFLDRFYLDMLDATNDSE